MYATTLVRMGILALSTVPLLKRNLIILCESATGISTAQIIDRQNASPGMWAFGEGMEVMYLVVLFYLLRLSYST